MYLPMQRFMHVFGAHVSISFSPTSIGTTNLFRARKRWPGFRNTLGKAFFVSFLEIVSREALLIGTLQLTPINSWACAAASSNLTRCIISSLREVASTDNQVNIYTLISA